MKPQKFTPAASPTHNTFKGPIWKQPYFLYIALTGGLFLFLMAMGFLALHFDWIPHR